MERFDLPLIKEYWVTHLDPAESYEPSDKSYKRWMRGEKLPKGSKERVLFGKLACRHLVPPQIIDLMTKAMNETRRLSTSANLQDRRTVFEEVSSRIVRESLEEKWPMDSIEVHYGTLFVFGALTIDDFPTKALALFERFPRIRFGDQDLPFLTALMEVVELTTKV